MALFMENHSAVQIMILGRWKSTAFLAYIRPQVLEWAELLSKDMIKHENLLDLGLCNQPKRQNSRSHRPKELPMPSFGLAY